ncbi:MAG TPA: D-alanyl-D-alanine carboxypeptidase family protein [Desulfobacteria bacterium]|nr:D-alanyl-D-alanine carboxypeptidase family protein [Desulfobacteria bacterium]
MIKRILISVIILMNLCFVTFAPDAEAEGKPNISADAAILMDLKTGQVLYAKNPFKSRPPASTTKVLTALIAIEGGKLNQKVKVSRKAAYTEGSSMYLKVGETMSLSDLIYGALMHSGNDACEAIAEHVAGSSEQFALLMNVKALSLGAVNSHFVNPHGLPDDNHYTCAYDLGLIARHALNNPVFSNIVSTRNKILADTEGEDERRLSNTNKLLWKYLWADGVKTGTTSKAGQCLISSATKGNRQLVAVVLHSGNRWQDSIDLFEYGFNRFEYSQVAVAGAEFGKFQVQNGEQKEVSAAYGSDLGLLIPMEKPDAVEKRVVYDSYPAAPLRKGQVIGSVSYIVNNCFAGRVNLVAAEDVCEKGFWTRFREWFGLRVKNFWGMFLYKL